MNQNDRVTFKNLHLVMVDFGALKVLCMWENPTWSWCTVLFTQRKISLGRILLTILYLTALVRLPFKTFFLLYSN